MPQPKVPPSERINTSYKQLKSITPELHSAATELSKTINELNDALEPLRLGVTAWAVIASGEDENNGYYWSRFVGYTQVDHSWGIALKQASGSHNNNEHDETIWAFSKAPRWMVIESIAKLPDVFEALIERVKDTTEKLKARTKQAGDLVAAIKLAAEEASAVQDKE
jgi:hypothetical protein